MKLSSIQRKRKIMGKKRKRSKGSPVQHLKPPEMSPGVVKYWHQRYSLFSKYEEGIAMDEEGWFSVTPEEIASRHAVRSRGGAVIDCFSGVGGNAIQFAKTCCHVVAIDIDPQKALLALNNAKIYGVEDNIDFVIGDFFQLAPILKLIPISLRSLEIGSYAGRLFVEPFA